MNDMKDDREEERQDKGADPGPGGQEERVREALAAFAEAGAAPPEPPRPTCWQALEPEEMPDAWAELRAWVEELVRRYPHLDHHVVPACWRHHNEHAEALVALRDYERLAFFPSSPASSPYNFQIALGQVEARLREWTARAGCLGEHREQPTGLRPVPKEEWEAFVAADVARREAREDE